MRFAIGFLLAIPGLGLILHWSRNLELLDHEQSLRQFWTPFLFSIFLLLSMTGIGRILVNRFCPGWNEVQKWVFSVSVGSALFSWVGGIGLLLLPNPALRVLFSCLMIIGASLTLSRLSPKGFRFHLSPGSGFLVFTLGLSVVLSAISSFLVSGHGDPLICYLNANRAVAETGAWAAFKSSPIFFLSSSWENLYTWAFSFFASGPYVGLVSGQRFAQFLSGILAQGGLAALSAVLVHHLTGKERLALVAALAAITLPDLRWMQSLAKNDLGNAFWILCGVGLLVMDSKLVNRFSAFMAGAFIGMAIIGKLSNGAILAFVLVLLISREISLKGLSFFAIGGIFGALPIFLRNGLLAGNPFYPFLQAIFHGVPLSSTLGAGFTGQKLFNLGFNPDHWLEFLKEQPWFFAMFLAPFWFGFSGQARKARFSVAVLAQAVFFLLVFRPGTEIRYLGSGLVLASLTSLMVIADLISKLPKPGFLFSALTVGVLASSNLPLFTLKQIFTPKYSRGDAELDHHSGGEAKRFIRMHHPDRKVVALGDYETYYMMGREYRSVDLDPELDGALGREGANALEVFKSFGFDLVLDAHTIMGGLAKDRSVRISNILEAQGYPVIFESKGARVISLRNANHISQ